MSSSICQTCCDDDQGHIRPRLLSPILKPHVNHRDTQEVKQPVTCSDKTVGGNIHQLGSRTVQIESPEAVAQAQCFELCKCNETSRESQDVGTQTDDKPTAKTCDASTQCSFVVHVAAKASAFLVSSFDESVQHPATGRQTNTALEPNTHTPSSSSVGNKEKHTPWKENKSGCFSDYRINNISSATNSDGKVILQRPMNPFVDALSMMDGRGLILR